MVIIISDVQDLVLNLELNLIIVEPLYYYSR